MRCLTHGEVCLFGVELPGEDVVEIRVRRFEGHVGVLRPRPTRRLHTALPVLGVQNPVRVYLPEVTV